MPTCSMEILLLHRVVIENEILAGKHGRRKLRNRPRHRGGIGMLVRVVT
jgi:hypothetical protein